MEQYKAEAQTSKRRLAEEIVQQLRANIQQGQYEIGEKLPTESALGEKYGVSRTVVREAIASLRAAGLVDSRRGSGLYVTDPALTDTSTYGVFLEKTPKEVPAVIDALELRAAVEIEAARLAAQRISNGQIERLHELHRTFIEKLAAGEHVEAEDFAFHEGIADATNNEAFVQFLRQLGSRTIPRNNLRIAYGSEAYGEYMSQLRREHESILDAVERRQPDEAANAMKLHLHGSLERYRRLARAHRSDL